MIDSLTPLTAEESLLSRYHFAKKRLLFILQMTMVAQSFQESLIRVVWGYFIKELFELFPCYNAPFNPSCKESLCGSIPRCLSADFSF